MSILHQCIGISKLDDEPNAILLDDTRFKAVLDETGCTLSIVSCDDGVIQMMYRLSKEYIQAIKQIMGTCIQYYLRPRIIMLNDYKPVFHLATSDFGELAELYVTLQGEVVVRRHAHGEESHTYTPW